LLFLPLSLGKRTLCFWEEEPLKSEHPPATRVCHVTVAASSLHLCAGAPACSAADAPCRWSVAHVCMCALWHMTPCLRAAAHAGRSPSRCGPSQPRLRAAMWSRPCPGATARSCSRPAPGCTTTRRPARWCGQAPQVLHASVMPCSALFSVHWGPCALPCSALLWSLFQGTWLMSAALGVRAAPAP
jgi:hypothetical protein